MCKMVAGHGSYPGKGVSILYIFGKNLTWSRRNSERSRLKVRSEAFIEFFINEKIV